VHCSLRSALHVMPTTWATWLNGARTVIFAMENQRPPRFLGNPHVNHALLLDPADGLAPGVAAQTLLPSTLKTVSASGSYSFRGSITRPSDPLCTLRGQGRPCTTQHSVPAGCQPLPGRLNSCRVPSEAFSRVIPHMTSHSSRLSLAHFQQNRPTVPIRVAGPLTGRSRPM
jgi:hypothetical protein